MQIKEEKKISPAADCGAGVGTRKRTDCAARPAFSRLGGSQLDSLHGQVEDTDSLCLEDRPTQRSTKPMGMIDYQQSLLRPWQRESGGKKTVAAIERQVSENREKRQVRESSRVRRGLSGNAELLRSLKSKARKRRMLCPRSMRYKI